MAVSYRRISKYMPGCDGTKLAVDLYLPEHGGRVPLLLKAGYAPRRQVFQEEQEAIERFLDAAYALAIVEVRGSGASFGVSDGFFGRCDGKDLKSIIDSLTLEDWCNGRAGMYGGSNYGMSQEITAAEQPERLFAVIPCDCSMDFYDQDFPNGCSALPNMPHHHKTTEIGTPVDEDPAPDYPMAHASLKGQERNLPFLGQHIPNMYRDDLHSTLGYCPNLEVPVWERMDVIRFGHIHVWGLGAWFDPGATNRILSWKSWGGRLLIGPWMHTGIYRSGCDYPNGDYDWTGEFIRFFDSCLKDRENGVSAEPPVRYYTIGAAAGNEWRYAADFPVEGTTFPSLYLSADGGLEEAVPREGSLPYRVRNDIMIYDKQGRMNRDIRRDMTPEDKKSLVYDSPPLPKDMEITGIPVLELWATSTHPDGNFIACLEQVSPDGVSRFITEGMIRASHAKEHPNPIYASMGLPYHRGYREDRVELTEETPLKLAFHLEAISCIVKAGNRLRISISCGGSGFQQPAGFPEAPEQLPTVRIYSGKAAASRLTLPVIQPTVTVFEEDSRKLHVYKRAVYLESDGRFHQYPCRQCYPLPDGGMRYVTERFTVTVREKDGISTATAEGSDFSFVGSGSIPAHGTFTDKGGEIPVATPLWAQEMKTDVRNLYIATVPVAKGDYGNVNFQLRNTFDLYADLIYPPNGEGPYPCIVNIHGFGGVHHQFETNTELLLAKGYAVASIDYRMCPPNVWPTSGDDAKGCIRYLKANAEKLRLDRNRFGIIGGSMGGYLTAMIAACNGDRACEGDIGGNTDQDSSVKAAAAYYAFTDLLHFGDDSAAVWPAQPDKITQSDGPFAPLGSLLGYVGPGKGLGEAKAHLYDPDPRYRKVIADAIAASPISHVTENSAPTCFVHGIYDCGVQVPMGQSLRMFEALTRKGVKSMVFLNNNGLFGEDPEVKQAVVEFLTSRV